MSDIIAIKQGLAQRAQDVTEMLLPRGHKEGKEWRCGSLLGEPGQSLSVHLAGHKAGLWCDFATDEAGDLIDLWQQTTGLKLVEVLDRAREYLGMEVPKEYRDRHTRKKTYKVPTKPKLSYAGRTCTRLPLRGAQHQRRCHCCLQDQRDCQRRHSISLHEA